MPPVVIVDTTVFLNFLNVPGCNQNRDAVLARFSQLLDEGANLCSRLVLSSRPAITSPTSETAGSAGATRLRSPTRYDGP